MIVAEYAAQVASLAPEKKLHFYEVLAHNLTIAIRSIWSNKETTDTEKLAAIKAVNEIMHRVTAKIWVLRLNTHEWTEIEIQAMIEHYVAETPAIAGEIDSAIQQSYEVVKRDEA